MAGSAPYDKTDIEEMEFLNQKINLKRTELQQRICQVTLTFSSQGESALPLRKYKNYGIQAVTPV